MTLNGEDVTFIDPWEENVETISRDGLTLRRSSGDERVDVNVIHTDDLDELRRSGGQFDILIVAVKSYDTQWATRLMLPFIHDETWVVSPQNGINELQIAPIVGADRMVGCVTTISAAMMEPGIVTRTDSMAQSLQSQPVSFKVGELNGEITSRVERLAELFEPAGHTVVTDDLWGERWTKMVTNCMANPTAAMTGLGSYDVRANEDSRKLMLKFGIEAVTVGRSMGYNVKNPIGDFTLSDLQVAATEGHPELEERFVGPPQTAPGRPSMAQDVIKSRKTEIDYLNGYVAQVGRQIGVPVHYSDAAVNVIKGIEAGEFEVGLENIARVESIVSATR